MDEISDYKYALDQSAIVAITDQKGIINHVNDNFCTISKYTRNELIGQDHRILNSGYHSKEFMKNLHATIAKGKVWKGEIKNKAKDNTYYWVNTTIVPFLNAQYKPYQYLAIRSDITRRKEAEEEIKINAAKALKQNDILEVKNTKLTEFTQIISHNLRAPLADIIMLVDFIELCESDENRMEAISKVKPVANNLLEVFDELIESIYVDKETKVALDKLAFKDCLENVLHNFEPQIQACKANISFDFDEAPTLYYPEKYIQSILTNLISNALKFKSPNRNPEITIKTKKDKNNILFSIRDNGLGINLNLYKNKLFKNRQTFHRHSETRGFGLFITKTQVEAMKGKIWVESEPNVGSTFYIEFANQNITV